MNNSLFVKSFNLYESSQHNAPSQRLWHERSVWSPPCCLVEGSSTRNDLDELASDDSLASTVEGQLEVVDHISGVG